MRCTVEDVEMPDLNAGEERDQHDANDPEEKTPMTTEARLRLRPEHSACDTVLRRAQKAPTA